MDLENLDRCGNSLERDACVVGDSKHGRHGTRVGNRGRYPVTRESRSPRVHAKCPIDRGTEDVGASVVRVSDHRPIQWARREPDYQLVGNAASRGKGGAGRAQFVIIPLKVCHEAVADVLEWHTTFGKHNISHLPMKSIHPSRNVCRCH